MSDIATGKASLNAPSNQMHHLNQKQGAKFCLNVLVLLALGCPEVYSNSLGYLVAKLWNELPDDIRTAKFKALFKSKLKTHLINNF